MKMTAKLEQLSSCISTGVMSCIEKKLTKCSGIVYTFIRVCPGQSSDGPIRIRGAGVRNLSQQDFFASVVRIRF